MTAGISVAVTAQSRVSSKISLALVNEQNPVVTTLTDAVFTLNASTGEFKGVINLFPIVPNPDRQDSLAFQGTPLQLFMSGRFPVGDISFLTSRENSKRYSMPCSCAIYDSVKTCIIQFNLLTFQDQPLVNETGATIYQSTMNFVMTIDPRDYGLNQEPFAINKPILIIAKDGVINKSL
jgi:hypothetical protein